MVELNYQLGWLTGEIIYEKYLPTLSTDMLHSKVVIEVTDKSDLEKHNKFEKQMDQTLNNPDEYSKIHKEWLEFYKPMARKYLPKILECRSSYFIIPTDIELFKKGLNDYLWDTDLSWYTAKDGFLVQDDSYGIHITTILLTRDDD